MQDHSRAERIADAGRRLYDAACLRCPMLRVDPRLLPRLDELETDLLTRRQRAQDEGWLGELEDPRPHPALPRRHTRRSQTGHPLLCHIARHAHDRRLRMTTSPKIHLDAAELVEMLAFISHWLQHDRNRLEPSLLNFVGAAGYNIDTLHADLSRTAFLPGDAGARLFGTVES